MPVYPTSSHRLVSHGQGPAQNQIGSDAVPQIPALAHQNRFNMPVPWRNSVESFPSPLQHIPVLTPYFMDVVLSRIPFPLDVSNSTFVQDDSFYGVTWSIIPRPQLIPKEIVYGYPFTIQHHLIVRVPFSYNPTTIATWEPPTYIAIRNRMEDSQYAYVELAPYDRTGTCLSPRYPNVILRVFKSFVNIAVDCTDRDLSTWCIPTNSCLSSNLENVDTVVNRFTLQQQQALVDAFHHQDIQLQPPVDRGTSPVMTDLNTSRGEDTEGSWEDETDVESVERTQRWFQPHKATKGGRRKVGGFRKRF